LDSEKIIIDVSDLNSGIYMLMITNDLGSVSSKFIKNYTFLPLNHSNPG
ncbi:T9SS type A sorting domain-containing protein, partial [Nonlabens mediterrranea]|nr:T9SS type A sorting domain-containing protein [Nonlabens mediterrranea]